ncbi:MAG: aminotransferase class I/II-fold pyridoxal phosphate-dependent enzyme [Thermomicrobiales bacterium]|nr:aminotransferase class I/II-fold pyridoxal phosphate-dependent enzyme [Thermomicrobiales bacterium]MCO5220390.1 aminotransferase class I/II-fold pyridoxal phosphate-dependent enzyme [Thermomicrobiales bacterium]
MSTLALDGSVSPYLPTREILDAIERSTMPERPPVDLARMLRARLAMLHGVSVDRIALFPHDDARFARIVQLRANRPVAIYPPGPDWSLDVPERSQLVTVERNDRFRIDGVQIQQTPYGATAIVQTPNDPTGTAIGITTAAQLARRAGLLVLDERSAEMQRRSMIPLVEEFDSIVLLRSFSDWAGLSLEAPGYAIATRRTATAIDRAAELSAAGLVAAMAAVGNASKLDAVAQRVRLERLRLYRMLRKLNFLEPLPSDGGYVLATVTRGERDQIGDALARRDIRVYLPTQARLQDSIRFSAISPAATARLKEALIDICRTELD